MKLIDGWREKLNRVWSVRVAIFTALLASADLILAQFAYVVPPVVYAALSVAVIVARVLEQTPKAA